MTPHGLKPDGKPMKVLAVLAAADEPLTEDDVYRKARRHDFSQETFHGPLNTLTDRRSRGAPGWSRPLRVDDHRGWPGSAAMTSAQRKVLEQVMAEADQEIQRLWAGPLRSPRPEVKADAHDRLYLLTDRRAKLRGLIVSSLGLQSRPERGPSGRGSSSPAESCDGHGRPSRGEGAAA